MNLFNMNEKGFLENAPIGMRLHKLELYNWGTFNKKIWLYEPKGQTTLLTGESGSGKSTVVDALLTLIVSPRKIVYNKAADSDAKERTVATYVMGVYGQKSAYEGKAKAESLRGNNNYSVVLATFKDEDMGLTVTMAIFFWFKENKTSPERFYVVSKDELFIDQDFVGFGNAVKNLKSKLKERGAQVFDNYNHYSDCFKKELGGIKNQAVNLFQQTISMKNVKALTEFVRENMLEDAGASEDIEKLLSYYFNLNCAHEAVVKARKQSEMLTPIHKNGTQWSIKKADIEVITAAKDAIPYWVALIKEGLYAKKISEMEAFLEENGIECEEKDKRISLIKKKIDEIKLSIHENGGDRLENLKREKEQKGIDLKSRKCKLESYLSQINQVNFNYPESPKAFRENQKQIDIWEEELSHNKIAKENERTDISIQLKEVNRDIGKLKAEIESLEGRASNIPLRLIQLRNDLCESLHISKEQLPFAGELIEVKENEAVKWEGAIERLMYSFGISLLVSDSIYNKVAQWVDKNQLKGRLVYFRVKPEKISFEAKRMNTYAVANKITVKEGSIFSNWLIRAMEQRFDHVCCEDLSVFSQEKRAITRAGQIKSDARHEKDDRYDISDRTHYVLGFSSQKKINALREKLNESNELYNAIDKKNKSITNKLNTLDKQLNALTSLKTFNDFSEIDTEGIKKDINDCQKQIDEIESTDSVLKTLNNRLQKETDEFDRQNKEFDELKKEQTLSNEKLGHMNQGRKENGEHLKSQAGNGPCQYLTDNKEACIGKAEILLEDSDKIELKYIKSLNERYNSLQDEIAILVNKIEKAMQLFNNAYPNETIELDSKIDYLSDYDNMLNELNKDGLPTYEAEFKNLLRTQVIKQIATFHAKLRKQEGDVKARIDDINKSLYAIDYSKGRYIKLNYEKNQDSEIRGFLVKLKSCIDNALNAADDKGYAEGKFLEVKEIIGRFQGRENSTQEDKKWTKKVTDVRNWLVFSVTERVRSNDEEYEHYTNSGGKSGGQKEKLAYTILAASLLYNYGLKNDYVNQTSFHLVAIDEAFLKSSDDSAKYGLELFQKLKFQLVIVTPLLKISTIEPYISHVGFVSQNDITHESSLRNITIDEYRKKRGEWEDGRFDKLD